MQVPTYGQMPTNSTKAPEFGQLKCYSKTTDVWLFNISYALKQTNMRDLLMAKFSQEFTVREESKEATQVTSLD